MMAEGGGGMLKQHQPEIHVEGLELIRKALESHSRGKDRIRFVFSEIFPETNGR